MTAVCSAAQHTAATARIVAQMQAVVKYHVDHVEMSLEWPGSFGEVMRGAEQARDSGRTKGPQRGSRTPGVLPSVTGATGFEPAISSLTGRYAWPLHHAPTGTAY